MLSSKSGMRWNDNFDEQYIKYATLILVNELYIVLHLSISLFLVVHISLTYTHTEANSLLIVELYHKVSGGHHPPNVHRLGHQRITCGPLLNSSKSIHWLITYWVYDAEHYVLLCACMYICTILYCTIIITDVKKNHPPRCADCSSVRDLHCSAVHRRG